MEYSELFIFIMEIVGTVAFASSGALLAIRKEMDLFGVCVLGVITSVGGGMIRDLILGITPPHMFRSPVYTMVALGVSVLLFCLLYVRRGLMQGKFASAYDRVMAVFDAVGLGIFTVMGINTAAKVCYKQNFLLLFVGLVTGVGGGLLRDVMAQEKPYILTRHVYACASLAGALVCVYLRGSMGELPAMTAGAAVVTAVRLLAMHYRWNLPRVKWEGKENREPAEKAEGLERKGGDQNDK